MQNSNLLLSYAMRNGRFSICATVKGTSKRNYKEIKTLVNPNFSVWDSRSQVFCEMTDEAIVNNQILLETKRYYQRIIDLHNPDGRELFEFPPYDVRHIFQSKIAAQNSNINENGVCLSLGAYLQQLIHELKFSESQVPSKNYQNYITFLHKLEQEGKIINVPIAQINDTHFEEFGNYIIRFLKGVNYIGLMKRFQATINRAKKAKLTSATLTFPYMSRCPRKKVDFDKVINGVPVLTTQQYKKFLKMDLRKVAIMGPRPLYYAELYRDFCVFLYEMKMRPCDVILLRYSDFRKGVMSIFNKKKMNYHNSQMALQINPLTPKAKEIIQKYQGHSTKGYVFPFMMNEHDWDIYDPISYNKWNNRKQATFERINRFLKKVQVELGVEESLTLYTFRHTAFTHEINQKKKNLIQIAKEGGTSVDMLEKHYYNHIKQ